MLVPSVSPTAPRQAWALCRISQRVQGGGHTEKGDGSVSSVSCTNVAAKTMPRGFPEEQHTGQGLSMRLGQAMLVGALARLAAR